MRKEILFDETKFHTPEGEMLAIDQGCGILKLYLNNCFVGQVLFNSSTTRQDVYNKYVNDLKE